MRQAACQTVVGGATMCWDSRSTDSGEDLAQTGVLFGPSRLADLGVGFLRDADSHQCSPWPLSALDRSAMFLKGLVVSLADHMHEDYVVKRLPYMVGGELRVRASASGGGIADVQPGNGSLAGFWTTSSLFCCQTICPSWLGSIGNALGYAAYGG